MPESPFTDSSYSNSGSDMEQYVMSLRQAVYNRPEGNSERSSHLYELSSLLRQHYVASNGEQNPEQALLVAREAVEIIPNDSPMAAKYLNSLGRLLLHKFDFMGDPRDLDEAIQIFRQCVAQSKEVDPSWPQWLTDLGDSIYARHNLTGSLPDLEEAIELARRALGDTAENDPEAIDLTIDLVVRLRTQNKRTGSIFASEEAVEMAQRILESCPENNPSRSTLLHLLAGSFSDRYVLNGVMDDLNQHIRTGDRLDLDTATALARGSVDLTPASNALRHIRLGNLTACLIARFDSTGSLEHLEECVKMGQEAKEATPKEHVEWPARLHDLGAIMQRKYQMTEDLEDLDEVIGLTQQALLALGPNHPQQADTMSLIALFFAKRYGETESPEDLQRTELFYRAALFQTQSPIVTRIEAGVKLISVCMVQRNMEKAYEDAKYVVDLIPQMAVRSLESSDKQDLLLKIGGVSSEAAGLALHLDQDPLVALSLLEKGRGIFALSLDEIRADINALEQQCPDLASKFVLLREQLSASTSSGKTLDTEDPEWNVDESRRHEAGDEFESLLGEIRQQSGFETFLLPPSESEIRFAAERGSIVIINTSMLRCDAILVESHQITSVPLTDFDRRDMIEYVKNGTFKSDESLQWLWDCVANPVLNTLGFDKSPPEGDWPHVWWIMTGLLNKFPIHAAGYHLKGSSETVIDRVISSYHGSIQSIIRSRKRPTSATTQTNALLVAMEATPGSSKLPFATAEIAAIRGICKSMFIEPDEPDPSRDNILSSLLECGIFHFAGHARTDPEDAIGSYLCLDGERGKCLTVLDLLDLSPADEYFVAIGGWLSLPPIIEIPAMIENRPVNFIGINTANKATMSANTTYCLVPISKTLVKTITGYNPLDIDTDILPSFPTGKHPLIVQAGYNKDIRMTALNLVPLQIDSLMQGSLIVPFVDVTKDGQTPIGVPVNYYIGGTNGQPLQAIVPSVASGVSPFEGTTIFPATFSPDTSAARALPNGFNSIQVKPFLLPNTISGPGIYAEAFDMSFKITDSSPYTAHTFHSLLNIPQLLNTNKCQRNTVYFNESSSEPQMVTGERHLKMSDDQQKNESPEYTSGGKRPFVSTYENTLTATQSSDSSITGPVEDPASLPTDDNVIKAFRDLTSAAQPGDYIYIHYSGHGTRIAPTAKAFSNQHTGDLALALLGGENGNEVRPLGGYRLAVSLNAMVLKGLVVTLVLDCCFAASIYRLDRRDIRFLRIDPDLASAYFADKDLSEQDEETPNSGYRDISMLPSWLINPNGYALLATCGPHEEAGEIIHKEQSHGALSHFLNLSLRDGGLNRKHKNIFYRLSSKFRAHSVQQNPALYGNKDQGFFGENNITNSRSTVLVVRNGQHFALQAGHAHGVSDGDEFILYPSSVLENNEAFHANLMKTMVERAGPLTSRLQLVDAMAATSENDWVAEPQTRRALGKFSVSFSDTISPQSTWPEALTRYGMTHAGEHGLECWFHVEAIGNKYKILTRNGEEVMNLPSLSQNTSTADDVVAVLEHLARYEVVKSLSNPFVEEDFRTSFDINIVRAGDRFGPDLLVDVEQDAGKGAMFELKLQNHGTKVLYLYILDLGPLWQIEDIYCGSYVVVPPYNQNERFMTGSFTKKFRTMVPDELRKKGIEECCDTLKVLVTSQPTSFDLLELPKIGHALKKRSPADNDRSGEATKNMPTEPEKNDAGKESLEKLADLLITRYQQTGNTDDLRKSLRHKMLLFRSLHIPNEASLWYVVIIDESIGSDVPCRYEETNDPEDLRAAITICWQVFFEEPSNAEHEALRVRLPFILRTITLHLYEKSGNLGDIEMAASYSRQVLPFVPNDIEDRANPLDEFARTLFKKYQVQENPDILTVGIPLSKDAISATPEGHPELPARVANLGAWLLRRYERNGDTNDLQEAIEKTELASSLLDKENFNQLRFLTNLGIMLFRQLELTWDENDPEQAEIMASRAYIGRSLHVNSIAHPLLGIEAARDAIRIFKFHGRLEEANSLTQKALQLLPMACHPNIARQDQQHAIQQMSRFAAEACSLSLLVGKTQEALLSIEFSCEIILYHLIKYRNKLPLLEQQSKRSAERFDQLRSAAAQPVDTVNQVTIQDRIVPEAQDFAHDYEFELALIRNLPNFQNFLTLPNLHDLVKGVTDGSIVIVNITPLSSDAIIILQSGKGIRSLNLPKATCVGNLFLDKYSKAFGHIRKSQVLEEQHIESDKDLYDEQFLSWLWTACVDPIVKEIAESQSSSLAPRVWWIGTGIASGFPFHAAGKSEGSTLDNVISSYIASITSLIEPKGSMTCSDKTY
ncbi:hypothetical protein CEK26_011535 [Fusarium fujikuroi]|nr:hypothetical protein CEK26_011535 [Fusarium fujikuroi]